MSDDGIRPARYRPPALRQTASTPSLGTVAAPEARRAPAGADPAIERYASAPVSWFGRRTADAMSWRSASLTPPSPTSPPSRADGPPATARPPHATIEPATAAALAYGAVETYAGRDWAASSEPLRSRLGRTGVRFLRFPGGEVVVAKHGRTIGREFVASQLAHRLGIAVPDAIALFTAPAPMLAARIQAPLGRAVMLMGYVVGPSFRELPVAVAADLRAGNARGQHILFEAGRIYAFDQFIGNADRFNWPGLTVNNAGNLMLAGSRVISIDGAVPLSEHVGTDAFYARHLGRLGAALALVHRPQDPEGQKVLARVARFFAEPMETEENWHLIGPHVTAGYRRGVRDVARLTPRELDRVLEACGGAAVAGTGVAEFLHRSLASFHAAVWTPALRGSES